MDGYFKGQKNYYNKKGGVPQHTPDRQDSEVANGFQTLFLSGMSMV
jgi:hypothetical protein